MLGGVDAQDVLRRDRVDHLDGQATLEHELEDIGDVVLARQLIAIDLLERLKHRQGTHAVVARVDLVDLELFLAGVLLLNDPLKPAVGITHDPPVPHGVIDRARRECCRSTRPTVQIKHRVQGRAVNQRPIAAEHEHISRRTLLEREGIDRTHHRVPRAQLLMLLGKLDLVAV